MKINRFASVGIFLASALVLQGCATYSSANMIRAQGGDIFVFWGTGWVKTQNASVTIYRSMDMISHIKDEEYPKIPLRPNIMEEGEGGSINIGKAQKMDLAPTTPVDRKGPIEQTLMGK